ncbi:hypothetical protein PF005_g22606 [Phytophthora fragariae]|nr:hypothetical protein PF009_g23386 [Phytophthora fragariae]KAE8983345.1 hypothetical protein PF011_g21232 [Phytophthora fragariae]KAE9081418.1 hypothetical protein PF007_g22670 [Phytophthora fragariae]KAE9081439.1 hypothetical protein PF010_g21996 [Phytophthora fragariae]KAE9104459.1 hypothetical protein PF006_g21899 [Phytophthora fragariae]
MGRLCSALLGALLLSGSAGWSVVVKSRAGRSRKRVEARFKPRSGRALVIGFQLESRLSHFRKRVSDRRRLVPGVWGKSRCLPRERQLGCKYVGPLTAPLDGGCGALAGPASMLSNTPQVGRVVTASEGEAGSGYELSRRTKVNSLEVAAEQHVSAADVLRAVSFRADCPTAAASSPGSAEGKAGAVCCTLLGRQQGRR